MIIIQCTVKIELHHYVDVRSASISGNTRVFYYIFYIIGFSGPWYIRGPTHRRLCDRNKIVLVRSTTTANVL